MEQNDEDSLHETIEDKNLTKIISIASNDGHSQENVICKLTFV